MKPKYFLFLGIVLFTLTSCPHDDGRDYASYIYVKGNDTLLVDYPDNVRDVEHHSKKLTRTTMEVYKDTFLSYSIRLYGGIRPDSFELQAFRKTTNGSVKIFYISYDLMGFNVFIPTYSEPAYDINYQALDSLMDIYGVTMPANQDTLTVPITRYPK